MLCHAALLTALSMGAPAHAAPADEVVPTAPVEIDLGALEDALEGLGELQSVDLGRWLSISEDGLSLLDDLVVLTEEEISVAGGLVSVREDRIDVAGVVQVSDDGVVVAGMHIRTR